RRARGAAGEPAAGHPGRMPVILLIDNYDSFSHNLARYFEELGESVRVVRNDTLRVEQALGGGAEAIVISPGPGRPEDAGISIGVVRHAPPTLPILGVCLGQQAIGVACGGMVVHGPAPVHGKLTVVHHEGQDLFTGIPSPFMATRYHSLVVSSDLPSPLRALARADDGSLMALRMLGRPVWGVQFHPEALLTEHGHAVLANFLALARGRVPRGLGQDLPAAESGEAG
ncbi:MAG: anthranilate synthase component II, partial [Gemmatimonadota bacterium]